MTNRRLIERYNEGWNAHDLDAILALHTADMVFENHTAGEMAAGPEVRAHIAAIFEAWPDLAFETRRLHAGPGHAVCEWTATATHDRPLRRGDLVAEPTGRRLSWRGVDVFTIRDGLVARKDVYSDSVTILRAVGLLS
jgi:steroid delta-isomerase-like uncharacterized protein